MLNGSLARSSDLLSLPGITPQHGFFFHSKKNQLLVTTAIWHKLDLTHTRSQGFDSYSRVILNTWCESSHGGACDITGGYRDRAAYFAGLTTRRARIAMV